MLASVIDIHMSYDWLEFDVAFILHLKNTDITKLGQTNNCQ
jgi:hypothetical protein